MLKFQQEAKPFPASSTLRDGLILEYNMKKASE